MTVSQIIRKLKEYDSDIEVTISDGYECLFYNTKKVTIERIESDGSNYVLDIGIGGCRE